MPSQSNPSDEPTPDERDTAAQQESSSGATSGLPDFPAGTIPLREYSDGSRFYVTISTIVRDLGYDRGDYLHITYNQGAEGEASPPALQFERISQPRPHDRKNPRIRPIIDNGSSYRITIPRHDLGQYGLDIGIEDYDGTDPFLFEAVYLSTPSMFFLHPLGTDSEVFRRASNLRSPIPQHCIESVADSLRINQSRLTLALETIGRSLSASTFEAANLPLAEVEPITLTLSSEGQAAAGCDSLSIYFAPVENRQSTILELFAGIYRLAELEREGCWHAHQEFAHELIGQACASNDSTISGEDKSESEGTKPDGTEPTERGADVAPNSFNSSRENSLLTDPTLEAIVLPEGETR